MIDEIHHEHFLQKKTSLQFWRYKSFQKFESFKFPFCRVFDRNGDGYISKSEFKHCMMHFGEKFTDDEVEEMIAEADANNDGQIDYTEFSQMILKEIDMESSHPQNHHKSPLHKKMMSWISFHFSVFLWYSTPSICPQHFISAEIHLNKKKIS